MLKFCSYGPNDAGFDVSGIRKCQIRRSWDFQKVLKFCSYGPNDAGFDVSGIRKCQIRRSWDFQNSKSAQIWDFQKTSKSGKKSRGYHTNFFKFESTKFGTPNEAKAHYNLPFLRPCWDPSRSSRRRPQNAGKIADCNGMKPQNWDFRKFAIF